jgi:NADPH-dependent 2,4-dienoyl-CoA reductase/sulfur reductase-like enzyme
VTRRYDLAVVGAGPAGLAAAALAPGYGMSTVVFDDQHAPGGQIHRGVLSSPLVRKDLLGDDYWQGTALIERFRRSGATHVAGAAVIGVTKCDDGTCELTVAVGGEGARRIETVNADAVILATGAQERPFPIPGWTLPGVITVGAAQVLLKTSGMVPSGRVVLAGSGPLLWLLATQYLRVGLTVDLLLDTTPKGRYAEAATHALGFLTSDYFMRGLKLLRDVRARVKVVEHVTALAAEGEGRLTALRYEKDGTTHAVEADVLLLHHGVVPSVNLAVAAGCALRWNDIQACWEPTVDDWGGTTVANLFVAGDGAGVSGAEASVASGQLAVLAVANALGRIDAKARDQAAIEPRKAWANATRGRRFFDTLYRPAYAFRIPKGDTIVCRCEEVTARAIVAAVAAGCTGPNQAKAFVRCGMGPCQGRFCGLTVTEIIARERKLSPAVVGYYRLRFPVKPLTLGELAAMATTDAAIRAVARSDRM